MDILKRVFGSKSPYYVARVYCKNCGWGRPDGQQLKFTRGDPLSSFSCPNCKCQTLKLQAAPKNGTEKVDTLRLDRKNPAHAALIQVRKALKKLGYTVPEAQDILVDLNKRFPKETDPNVLLEKAIKEAP